MSKRSVFIIKKCVFPDGLSIKPNGINELDPCLYETEQILTNCIVEISKCKKCGNISVSWKRTTETEEVPQEEWNLFI